MSNRRNIFCLSPFSFCSKEGNVNSWIGYSIIFCLFWCTTMNSSNFYLYELLIEMNANLKKNWPQLSIRKRKTLILTEKLLDRMKMTSTHQQQNYLFPLYLIGIAKLYFWKEARQIFGSMHLCNGKTSVRSS